MTQIIPVIVIGRMLVEELLVFDCGFIIIRHIHTS